MNPVYQTAQLACIDIYDPIAPNVFDKIYRINETVCGTKLIDKRLHVVMQGTESLPGWMAESAPTPIPASMCRRRALSGCWTSSGTGENSICWAHKGHDFARLRRHLNGLLKSPIARNVGYRK